MIKLNTKQSIILKHLNGDSNRQIAKDLGIDKNTVNKYVKEYDDQVKAVLEQDSSANPNELIAAIVEKPVYRGRKMC